MTAICNCRGCLRDDAKRAAKKGVIENKGRARLMHSGFPGVRRDVFDEPESCPACDGEGCVDAGEFDTRPCPVCAGYGVVVEGVPG